MPTVYLKGGKTVEVSLENLEAYLYENSDRIETRKKKRRRKPLDLQVTASSK